jgi:hypothetical protein
VVRWFAAVLLYGILNAVAYSGLLPLWEGFDEAYHYGYVQSLSTTRTLPVLGHATLSQEVWHAFQLVPVSHYLQPFTRAPLNFGQYFEMSPEERAALRHKLESLPAAEKYAPQPDKPDYEVNQAPLPYFFMAAIDGGLSGLPLTTRVLSLRLVCSIISVVLIAHSIFVLSRRLQLPDLHAAAAAFCVFSSQMLYATICRVSNDWLAVPLMGYFIFAAIRVHERGSSRDCFLLGLAFSAALLTRAYFLFLAPLAIGLIGWVIWRKRATALGLTMGLVFFGAPLVLLAGPWYVRNLLLYRNLTGTVESTSGLGIGQLVASAQTLPWSESVRYMAHSSLWTGNNSFITFSAATLNGLLLLLAASLLIQVIYFIYAKSRSSEWIVMAAVILFGLGLASICVAFFASSKGAVIAAVPWYAQVLLVPLFLLVSSGMFRVQRLGRIMIALAVLAWGYLLAATYFVKLIPLYSGFSQPRAHLAALWTWYVSAHHQRDEVLRTICLVSPRLLWGFIGSAMGLGVVLCAGLVTQSLSRPAKLMEMKSSSTTRP